MRQVIQKNRQGSCVRFVQRPYRAVAHGSGWGVVPRADMTSGASRTRGQAVCLCPDC